MKLSRIVSSPVQFAIKTSAVVKQSRVDAYDRSETPRALHASTLTRWPEASRAMNPLRLLNAVPACLVGLAVLPQSAAAALWGASQVPMQADGPAPFPFPEQEGSWRCIRFTDGKADLQGVWRQTSPDQWGVDFIAKLYPVENKNWDMDQTIMWHVKSSPFRGTHWPADERYGVQDFGGGVRRNGTSQFIWDLNFNNRAEGWHEQWIDEMNESGVAYTRARFSDRSADEMKLQSMMSCTKL